MNYFESTTHAEVARLGGLFEGDHRQMLRLRKRVRKLEELLQLTDLDPAEGREDEIDD